ncbi:dihydrolipoyllysine-residue acetyltransferase component of acetoin cleaving system-like protein [Trifolium pratense]|nr:dihydrolipoyllysine-residue acetyltransferase component of acetoin cleaving system-like protein [Trifolium pratense]
MELLGGLSLGKVETSNISPLQQEVLILWGEEDHVFPVQMAHELKEIISKNAKIELIKEASHVPQIEKPEEFNKIILKFLRPSS